MAQQCENLVMCLLSREEMLKQLNLGQTIGNICSYSRNRGEPCQLYKAQLLS